MWNTKSKGSTDITMTEGDYGVSIPFVVQGVTIDAGDSVLLTIKKEKNGKEILEKNFTNIVANTIDVSFTEAETDDLKIGSYVYTLDWYKNGVFMYCLVNNAKLKVEDKA
jgi:hypothetical protein